MNKKRPVMNSTTKMLRGLVCEFCGGRSQAGIETVISAIGTRYRIPKNHTACKQSVLSLSLSLDAERSKGATMPENMTNEQLDREVLHQVTQHVGKANAIDRWVLVEEIFGPEVVEPRTDDNHFDRDIRYSVNRLRLAGWHICDLGDGHGRYIAQNAAEFWEWYGSYAKPLKSRADILRAVKKSALERWPNLLQPALFDLDELEVTA